MIPYDLSLIKAFVFDCDGVLSPNVVPIGSDGNPVRMANVKDGYALHLARKHGYHIAVISGAESPLVVKRFNLLGIEDVYVGVADKLPRLKGWMEAHGLAPEQVAYAGDDIPDIPCLQYVGLSVAPADAAADVLGLARYVSGCKGGDGVARDIIEQTMRAHGDWLHIQTAYKW